ncbi:MAG TPA: transferrin receptor-like dimerization domain-containing protein [Allosphingosinicella sp.]|jgi:N-acetylated-alpha-linked acidic dipeptidase|nr:transferrin receptor-like dimerization domain-containing protein [Allosphingosinicella sp.]
MSRIWRSGLIAALLLGGAARAALPTDEKAHEVALDASVSSEDQMAWLKTLSSEPNNVGAPHDRANAEFILARFKEFGWDAHIETFQVLYPTPISTTIELVTPEHVRLGGQEPPVPGDATSSRTATALPPYVAYQGDGDVTAPLVYVNYGMPTDYDALARRGIDVKGKIVIARYGSGWRGLKPKLAQDHGAAGCIIYSDPADDGYGAGDPYPQGPTRPPHGVQRGSVQELPTRPGDPLTPDEGATANAHRLTRAQAETILKIPVLPMSYADATVLLSHLDGPVAPAGWRGALPFTYHIGGAGAVKVHLAVKSDWSLKPIYDVIAMIPGSRYPDQWVIRGNHHDGWVFGAEDPLSGNVAMLSEAKALGALRRSGWQPLRTIVYASWDGEEPGLLGSTEWAEDHAAELKKKGVLYINTDGNGRGELEVEGDHSFQHLVNSVAADVRDPESGATALQRMRAKILSAAYDSNTSLDNPGLAAAQSGADLPIGPLGSGSDYTAFYHHIGLPAMNVGYGGESESAGVYHSVYDSYDHFTRFDDPGLKYGAALSKTVGRLVLRVADADTVPQRFADFANTVDRYLQEVKKLEEARRNGDRLRDKMDREGDFRIAMDPLKPVGPPEAVVPTPHVELAVLEDAVDRLKASANAYDAAYADKSSGLTPERRDRLNAMLRDIDQLLILPQGLPFRPWYKNLISAAGRFTGYGAKTLPGVREAIEERRFADAAAYARFTAAALNAYSDRLDAARRLLEEK